MVKSTFLLRKIVLVAVVGLVIAMASPASAMAKRAANYGYDWSAWPFDQVNLYDAASRSAYYQGLDGFTTMTRDRGTAGNLYDKLSGADPNAYEVINVISHAEFNNIVTRPDSDDDWASCLYEDPNTSWGAHMHGIMPGWGSYEDDIIWADCVGYKRLQNLSSVPSVRWILFQGCKSADDDHTNSITEQAHTEGVDLAAGFGDSILIGGVGGNGQSIQYNFSARYWKSLYEGAFHSQAVQDAAAQVEIYHQTYGGYDTHRRFGSDARL